MHYRRKDLSCGISRRSKLPPGRTIPLIMGLLVALAQGTLPGGQQDTVVEMMSVELEASMQSFALSEFQATLAAVAKAQPLSVQGPAAVTEGLHVGLHDSSAVVGQVFQMRVAPRPANGSCNIHVSNLHQVVYDTDFKNGCAVVPLNIVCL